MIHPKNENNKNVNFISRVFFCWMIPLFRTGFKRDLTVEDLGQPLDADLSKTLGDKLETNWIIELQKWKETNKKPSFLKAIIKTFILEYIFDGFMIFVYYVGCRTFQPLLLAELLLHLNGNGRWDSNGKTMALACGMLVISFLSTFIYHHTMLHQQRLGMRIRIASCSLMYRKILRMHASVFGRITGGQVVNMLSNDVNRFDSVLKFLHVLWVAPIQIIVSFFLYSHSISPLTFIGIICVMLPILLLQGIISKFIGKYRLKIARQTDERIKKMNEIIYGIQTLKMYAWEEVFAKNICKTRNNELTYLKRASLLKAINSGFFMLTEKASLYITLVGHVLLGYPVNASTVYSLSQFYNTLQTLLTSVYPHAISSSAECLITIKRIQDFLLLEEMDKIPMAFYFAQNSNNYTNTNKKENKTYEGIINESFEEEENVQKYLYKYMNGTTTSDLENKSIIEIKDATLSWSNATDEYLVKNISITFQRGKSYAVIGPTGAGKSSLLQMILKETTYINGTVSVNGKVSYANQEPWLFLGTVRENILFGLDYEHKKYKEVIKICALDKDFQRLPQGDQTLVGERGVILSGGQRSRINLARALYRQADIYLLDDPLSCLDTSVASHISQHCFNDYLSTSTRIIVTQHLQYLKSADYIIVLDEGKIQCMGSYNELTKLKPNFTENISINRNNISEQDEEDTGFLSTNYKCAISRRISVASTIKSEYDENDDEKQNLEDEQKMSGKMHWNVCWRYWTIGKSPWLLSMTIITIILSHIAISCSDCWVTYWTNQNNIMLSHKKLIENSTTFNTFEIYKSLNLSTMENNKNETYGLTSAALDDNKKAETLTEKLFKIIGPLSDMEYIYVYSTIIVTCIILALCSCILFFISCIKSSKGLHDLLLKVIIKAPMQFYDSNPSGRILNRFSKDLGYIDELLPKDMLDTIHVVLFMISTLIIVAITNKWSLIPIAILVLIFFIILNTYLQTAQDIKRLEGITRSPVFSHSCATIKGIFTIRSANAETSLANEFDLYQDIHTASWYNFLTSRATLGFWVDMLGIIFVTCVTFSFLLVKSGQLLSGDVGLAISQSLTLMSMLQFGIKQLTEVISHFTSCERILQYCDLEVEKLDKTDEFDEENKKLTNWPQKGTISFKNVTLQYNIKDKPVLENFNIHIENCWKVGIVGRTGAGKTSIIAALFRLAKIHGEMIIDEIETDSISLQNLRSKISIIPQEPILFSATIRYNLDPFEIYNDYDLWNALESVHLKNVIPSLDLQVLEGGANFSLGQKQLICFARAILENNKILILDEATANIDVETDKFIQQIIRKRFSQCTIITIAHKLNTIIDTDKVIVMDAGRCVEFNHPFILLQNPDSRFSVMVRETGIDMAAALFAMAENSYYNKFKF